jgi:hypothetical protein
MFKTIPGPEREKLGFRSEVFKQFKFLVSEYGFHCVEEKSTYLRFESSNVFVNIYHGRSSYEIGLELGLLPFSGEKERKVTMGELEEFVGNSEETLSVCQANTQEVVEKCVSKLASFLKQHGKEILRGDCSTFHKLFKIQQLQSDKYLETIKLNRIRTKANDAWQSKDYTEVVKLFEPVKDSLTPSEIKKLNYCKNKI